jgi:hypothetical protein
MDGELYCLLQYDFDFWCLTPLSTLSHDTSSILLPNLEEKEYIIINK